MGVVNTRVTSVRKDTGPQGPTYSSSLVKIASTQGDAGMGQALPAALSLPGMNAEVSRATG
jgi:hypothetical protein